MSTNSPYVPRSAVLSTSPGTVQWASGNNFNGYVWIGLILPTGYSQPTLFNSFIPQQLPRYVKVPVINGAIDTTTAIPWTSDIDPPGSSYVAYWMDNNNTLIAPASGTASAFQITGSSMTLTVPTLTMPVYSAAAPVPQTSATP